MSLSLLRCTLPLALAVGSISAQEVAIADQLFPGAVARDEGPVVTRLVDDLTGAPIAGAEVFLVAESKTPIAGEFWFSHRGVSDSDGFVRIERPNGNRDWNWQVMKHPTLGVAERTEYVEPIWRIGRTFDVPLEIRDWCGRRAAGARVGFCGGCGHSPDIANATADANGFAVLRGIDPQQDIADLYVHHPGLHFFYDSVRWRPGEPPMVVSCNFGPAQTGRVVDHEGNPVAGAYVGGGSRHRGPWGRTAADGTFTILGGERGDAPHTVVLPGGREIFFSVVGDAPYPVTLHLPDLASSEAYQGPAEVALPQPRPAVATRPVRVTVQDAPPSAELEFGTNYPGDPAENEAADGPVDVPRQGPFRLLVWAHRANDHQRREFVFPDGGAIDDPLIVRWPAAAFVTGRVVDPQGTPLPVRARWSKWSDRDDERSKEQEPPLATGFTLTASDRHGWQLLELSTGGAAPVTRLLWVMVPGPGGSVDLGTVQVGGPPQLRVVEGDGSPLAAAVVGLSRPGWQEVGSPIRWALADDGAWRGPDLRTGDTIVVRRTAAAVPFRTVLQGDGPWQISPPAGALDLEVVGANGAPLAATVVVGDHYDDSDDGRITLRGLPVGPLRCYVGAPGHRSAIVDANVTANATAVRIELPPR